MINKKTFLKNILTTASSLAITMGASEAMAVPSVQATSLGGISHTSQNTGGGIWHGDGSSLSNGDSVLLTFANDTLNITTNVNIAGIDLNNLTSITGAITSNSSGNGSSIGSIGHAGAGGVIALHINNGIGITLTGTQTVGGVVAANTYSGLGAVTLGSTTGGAAGTVLSVTATGAVTFTNTFDSYTGTTDNFPILNISGANHIFSGNIGSTSYLQEINIIDGSHITFTNVGSAYIHLQNTNSAITIDTSSNSANVIGWIVNSNMTPSRGSLFVSGTHAATFNSPTGINYLASIDTTGSTNANAVISFQDDIATDTMTIGAAPIAFHKNVNINSSLTMNSTSSSISFAGYSASPTSIVNNSGTNNSGSVAISGANTTFTSAITVGSSMAYLNEILFQTDNSLILGANANLYTKIHTTTTGEGSLVISGGDATLFNSVGTDTHVLKQIGFNNNHSLTISSSDASGIFNIYAPIVNNTGTISKGSVYTSGTNSINFIKNVGVGGNGALSVIDTTASGGEGTNVEFISDVAAVTINAGGSVNTQFDGNVTATTLALSANAIVTFNNTDANTPTVITVPTITSGANGTINIDGAQTIVFGGGTIGTAMAPLSALNFASATQITLGGETTIYGDITNNSGTNNQGWLYTEGNLTLYGSIGASGALLNILDFVNDNTTFTVDSTAAARNIWVPVINSADPVGIGAGSIYTRGANAITFHSTVGVGGIGAFQTIDTTGNAVATATFVGEVQADTLALGAAPVVFQGQVTIPNINMTDDDASITLTNTNSTTAITPNSNNTGTVLINGPVTFGNGSIVGLEGFLNKVLLQGGNSLTIDGTTISAPILAATAGSQLIVTTDDSTIFGSIGSDTQALDSVNFESDNTLTLSASDSAIAIYAPITTTTNGTGTLVIDGDGDNNTVLHGDVGTNIGNAVCALKAINLTNHGNLVIDANGGNITRNIYAPIKALTNNGGRISFNAGTINIYNNIGDDTHNLQSLSLNNGTTAVFDGPTDIYSHGITQNGSTLSAMNDITIHAANYIAQTGTSTFNAGVNTITIDATTGVSLSNDIVINVSYNNTADQVVLDFSGSAGLTTDAMSSLTYVVNTNGHTPAHETKVTVINLANGMTLSTGATISSTDHKWTLADVAGLTGVIIYDHTIPAPAAAPVVNQTPASSSQGSGVPNQNASADDIDRFNTQFGFSGANSGNGSIAGNGANSGNGQNTSHNVLNTSIFGTIQPNTTNTTLTTSNSTVSTTKSITQFKQNVDGMLPTETEKSGFLGAVAQEVQANPSQTISPETSTAVILVMSEKGTMPTIAAASVLDPSAGASAETQQTIVQVSAVGGGPAISHLVDSVTTISTSNASSALGGIAARTSLLNTPSDTSSNINLSSSRVGLVPSSNTNDTSNLQIPTGQTITISTDSNIPKLPTPQQPSVAPRQEPDISVKLPGFIPQAEEETEAPAEDLQAMAAGIAAGSGAYDKYGVWGMVNAGIGHQKLRKGDAGFKSISKGIILGVDTMINDRSSVGFTITNSMNDIKYKDSSLGNKTDTSSYIAALYGNHNLKNNWFIRGSALFNKTHINNKALRPVLGSNGLAQAKYNVISYGGEAAVGFSHIFQNGIVASPNVGIRIIHNNAFSYTETGNTHLNNSMTQNAMTNYTGLFGLSVSKSFVKYGMDITPEAHVNMQYGIHIKNSTGMLTTALAPNKPTSFSGNKPGAFNSTYGVGLNASDDRYEYGISADMSLGSKYVGYQGSLKLKIKF